MGGTTGQRILGVAQIASSIVDAAYGGYGNDAYLAGSGIKNVAGRNSGTGRQGWKGFLKDSGGYLSMLHNPNHGGGAAPDQQQEQFQWQQQQINPKEGEGTVLQTPNFGQHGYGTVLQDPSDEAERKRFALLLRGL